MGTGEGKNKYLTEEDYEAVAKKVKKASPAYKAELTKDAKAMKSTVKDVLYAPEKEKSCGFTGRLHCRCCCCKNCKRLRLS